LVSENGGGLAEEYNSDNNNEWVKEENKTTPIDSGYEEPTLEIGTRDNPATKASEIPKEYKSGVYSFKPQGTNSIYDLFVDMHNDGGGWVLIYKTNKGSIDDRTDSGYNVDSLCNQTLNTVGILPRLDSSALGTIYKVSSDCGYTIFWKGVEFYTTDKHPGDRSAIEQRILVKYKWDDNWDHPSTVHISHGIDWSPKHGLALWGPKGAHFVSSRWDLDSPKNNGGLWFNQVPEGGPVFISDFYAGWVWVKERT